MPVARLIASRVRASPSGPSSMAWPVQWNTMMSTLASASAPDARAMSSVSCDSGRFHLPVICRRVTWMPSSGGAK